MKNLKKPVILWGLAGLILSLCTLVITLVGLLSEPVVRVDTEAVVSAAEQTLDCARTGDFEALQKLLAGAPDLGPAPENTGDTKSILWQAYLESLEYQFSDQCHAEGDIITLDMQLTCLDIPAVIAKLQETVPTILVENTTEGHEAVLLSATEDILSQPPMTERTVTLQLRNADGGWKVLANETFVQLLTGFVSE